MINSKSALIRKLNMTLNQVPRSILRFKSLEADYLRTPPMLANSLAKSGTYLLVQLLQGLTSGVRFGNHLSSWNTSVFLEKRADSRIIKSIKKIVPNEIVPAHIFHSESIGKAIIDRNIVHYFIIRDPRNLILSEVDYLTGMARWHINHGLYKNGLKCDKDRIIASITGVNPLDNKAIGLSFGERLKKYKGWMFDSNVCVIHFENMISASQSNCELHKIIDFYNKHSNKGVCLEDGLRRMKQALSPSQSHTYSGAGNRTWQDRFDDELLSLLDKQLDGLKDAFDVDW